MNIYDQLQAVEDRYEELGELLSDPDVVSDTKRFMELSKEEASTRDTVTAYREYKQVLQNIVDAEEMIKEAGGDADLEEMAKQELKDAKAEKEEYEEKLKILLLPKDPNDDKNIILKSVGQQEETKPSCLLATSCRCIKNMRKAKVGALRSWKPLTMALAGSKKS